MKSPILILSAVLASVAAAGTKTVPLAEGWKMSIRNDAPRNAADLDGLSLDEDEKPEDIWIRAKFPMAKSITKDRETVFERKGFKVPADWKGREITFVIDSTEGCRTEVSIGGKSVGKIGRGEAGEFDVTELLEGRIGKDVDIRLDVKAAGQKTSYMIPSTPTFVCRDGLRLDDVFVDTSWRRQEVAVTAEIASIAPGAGRVEVEIADADGKAVKRLSREVTYGRGRTPVVLSEKWADATTWEISRPYLYTCRTVFTPNAAQPFERKTTFGFREVWREGREIMMNGHVQRLRPVYSFGANGNGAEFLSRLGFNTIYYCHGVPPREDAVLEELSRLGLAAIVPCADVHRPVGEADMARRVRRYRNHPCVVAMYHGVNRYCPWWTMWPDMIGTFDLKDKPSEEINRWTAFGHTLAPGVLFYSHADGNSGDIASHNLYMNFIPLQEREEWLKTWNERGTRPYMAAEFGQPYLWSWFRSGFAGTEFLSIYFGDAVYAAETPKTLSKFKGLSWGGQDLWNPNPMFWDFRELLVSRCNRAFRAWGLPGGLVWFNLNGYGAPKYELDENGQKTRFNYYFAEKVPENPPWATRDVQIFSRNNRDFCAFIGGGGVFTDKTHAYVAGETVRKQLMLVWDGFGEKAVSCTVKAEGAGFEKTLGPVVLKQGEIRALPFEFVAPQVEGKTACRLVADFGEGVRDEFAFEVYPKDALAEAKAPKGLRIVPAYSLSTNDLATVTAPAPGERVLVLAQRPDVWRALGFDVEDAAPRNAFPRDFGVGADALSFWRGTCDQPFAHGKRLVSKKDHIGPRGGFTHAVAAYVLRNPSEPGYLPLVDCEFDLNYTPALRKFCANGAVVTFSTFEFGGRLGADPAATAVWNELVAKAAEAPRAAKGEVIALDEAKAAELGFTLEPRTVYQAKPIEGSAAFRAIGPSLLRWRDSLEVKAVVRAPEGWTVSPDGLFAEKDGTLVCQVPVGQLEARYAKGVEGMTEDARTHFRTSALLSMERIRQLWSRLRTNLGARAEEGKIYVPNLSLPDPYKFNFW